MGAVVAPVVAELQAVATGDCRWTEREEDPNARGKGEWKATQVMRVLERNASFPVTIQDKAAASAQS